MVAFVRISFLRPNNPLCDSASLFIQQWAFGCFYLSAVSNPVALNTGVRYSWFFGEYALTCKYCTVCQCWINSSMSLTIVQHNL